MTHEPIFDILTQLNHEKERLRSSTRYPYTYACDWLRITKGYNSRSEAAHHYKDRNEAVEIAEMYILYESLLEIADKVKNLNGS